MGGGGWQLLPCHNLARATPYCGPWCSNRATDATFYPPQIVVDAAVLTFQDDGVGGSAKGLVAAAAITGCPLSAARRSVRRGDYGKIHTSLFRYWLPSNARRAA